MPHVKFEEKLVRSMTFHADLRLGLIFCPSKVVSHSSNSMRDVPTGGVGEGSPRPPIFSNLQESWSKGSHAAMEMATVLSVNFCFSK